MGTEDLRSAQGLNILPLRYSCKKKKLQTQVTNLVVCQNGKTCHVQVMKAYGKEEVLAPLVRTRGALDGGQ